MFLDVVRLSFQHRTLYCYLVLSVWIVLMILGMYRYMPTNQPSSVSASASSDYYNSLNSLQQLTDAGRWSSHAQPPPGQQRRPPPSGSHRDADTAANAADAAAGRASADGRHAAADEDDAGSDDDSDDAGAAPSDRLAECSSPIERIAVHEDGGLPAADWQLLGVLLFVRHGDRGPMAHVRGVNAVDCGVQRSQAPQRRRPRRQQLQQQEAATAARAATAASVARYRAFLANATAPAPAGSTTSTAAAAGRPLWSKAGPFHGNALLPPFATSCLLGQLTFKGIAQLLQTGQVLQQAYGAPLGLHSKPPAAQHAPATLRNASTSAALASPLLAYADDGLVEIYATRYRRTFQSAMALAFGLLPAERWLALAVRESHSIAFCFDECVCPLVGALQRRVAGAAPPPAAAELAAIETVAQTLLEQAAGGSGSGAASVASRGAHAMELRDAVLAVLCHDARLPCRRAGDDDRMAGVVVAPPTPSPTGAAAASNNDFINIDQDEQAGANSNHPDAAPPATPTDRRSPLPADDRERRYLAFEAASNQANHPAAAASNDDPAAQCVRTEHIGHLMAYTNRVRAAEHRHADHRRQALLRAYGLLRHIVGQMLRMLSQPAAAKASEPPPPPPQTPRRRATKLVLYAGHDRTLEFLLAALGLTSTAAATGTTTTTTTTEAKSDQALRFVPLAARLAFEVYRSAATGEPYFRLVYQGADVTQRVRVCEGGRSLRVRRATRRGARASLCPIENIVRFVHDDYFAPFNTTNFRDACQLAK